jgi:hypothetical protein
MRGYANYNNYNNFKIISLIHLCKNGLKSNPKYYIRCTNQIKPKS